MKYFPSCESEDDEDYVEIKHARTGAGKKRKKKDESEDEEDESFACVVCGKLIYSETDLDSYID